MKINFLPIFLSIYISGTASQAQISNFKHPKNLELTHRLGCIAPHKLSPEFTPVDLLTGISACAKKEKYDEGVLLLIAFHLYGQFDSQSISNQRGIQAKSVLDFMLLKLLSNEKGAILFKRSSEKLKTSAGRNEVCKQIRATGHPTYIPYYMLAHSIDAARKKNGRVEYLSKEELRNNLMGNRNNDLWDKVLTSFGCSQ
jgi:hypothetical protein